MLKKEAREITGGLSKPSKMPGPAHNLPAVACKTGAKLVTVPGSVCAGCYALKSKAASIAGPALGVCDGNTNQGPGLV